MKPIIITCPTCREVLEIDADRGIVLKHHPEVKPKPGGDFLKERLKSLQEEKERRDALVADQRGREARRQEQHRELLRKLREETADPDSPPRPVRDLDLD